MSSALISSAFGYMKASCRAELRTLIIKSRDQKRWGRDHLLQLIFGKCESSSSLVLQCRLSHFYQISKLRSSRWHVWIDFEHLEIVCYLQSPPSKLHLWLHVVNKSLLLWPQMSAMALPFPSWAFLATRTECASPPTVRQTDRKQWQESPLS